MGSYALGIRYWWWWGKKVGVGVGQKGQATLSAGCQFSEGGLHVFTGVHICIAKN
jgi:hypothetical protein